MYVEKKLLLPHTAIRENQVTTRRYQEAKILSNYLEVEKYAYIHLFDGGISDNLGVRFILNYTAQAENIWQLPKL